MTAPFDEHHQGGPGLVHGGVVSAALDDGDEPLGEARGAFVHVPLEHFLATSEGREAAARWRRANA